MRKAPRGRVLLACGAVALASLAGTTKLIGATPDELLKLADRPKQAFAEAVIHAKITVIENGKTTSPAEFELYKKGDDRGLVVFTAGKQRGRKMLTVGDKVWLIVPGSSHAIAVTPNQRLMGGASMADVSKLRFSEEFRASTAGPPETVDGRACDVLKLDPKSAKSSYGGGTLWVDRDEHLARKAVVNLVSGKPAKEITFDRYGNQAGKTVLESMTIKDLLAGPSGPVTRIDYTNYRVAKIDDELLTPEGALNF
ncbi:MAG TPA: outer membrane lipoprotein-sorting protein [Thermoanaerobaculia bacterium]|nr:outer membrane lipoprotein-sorting protein [Thermoanaerobaculia bacterium]